MYKKRVRKDTRITPLDEILITILYKELKVPASIIAERVDLSKQHVHRIVNRVTLEKESMEYAMCALRIKTAQVLNTYKEDTVTDEKQSTEFSE